VPAGPGAEGGFDPDEWVEPKEQRKIDRFILLGITAADQAVRDADLVVTDVWASMGHEDEAGARREAFRAYQVTPELMGQAAPQALFMHCLPAHRGEEVSAAVIDHPDSVVWDEAGNRLHAQKSLLDFLLRAR